MSQPPSKELSDLRDFFWRNPEEELTIKDISQKFEVPLKRAYRLAQSLRDDGLCETVCIVRRAKPE